MRIKKIPHILLFLCAFFIFAEDFTLSYTKEIKQGDALFLRLIFNVPQQKTSTALITLKNSQTQKKAASTQFYALDKNTYFAAVPISFFLNAGKYDIICEIHTDNKKTIQTYPLSVLEKTFESETIKLNNTNTAIKTNVSQQRLNQIERLNNLFNTADYSKVRAIEPFVQPVQTQRRTSPYGWRRIYEYDDGKSSTEAHYGIDFGVPTGTAVFSCAAGKAVLTEERISTGFTVVIEHMPGLYSAYYHLSSYSVSEGQEIKKGEKIGISGATGLATGPHLHWEVRLLGTPVNPDFFISDFK